LGHPERGDREKERERERRRREEERRGEERRGAKRREEKFTVVPSLLRFTVCFFVVQVCMMELRAATRWEVD
jgi:hypothetical protein